MPYEHVWELSIHTLMSVLNIGQEWIGDDGTHRKILSISVRGACARIMYSIGRREYVTYADTFAAWIHKTRAVEKDQTIKHYMLGNEDAT